MGIYIVTDMFQFMGGMCRKGEVLRLDEATAADPYVAAHVRALQEDEAAPAARPAPNLTNGAPAKPKAKAGNRPKSFTLEA